MHTSISDDHVAHRGARGLPQRRTETVCKGEPGSSRRQALSPLRKCRPRGLYALFATVAPSSQGRGRGLSEDKKSPHPLSLLESVQPIGAEVHAARRSWPRAPARAGEGRASLRAPPHGLGPSRAAGARATTTGTHHAAAAAGGRRNTCRPRAAGRGELAARSEGAARTGASTAPAPLEHCGRGLEQHWAPREEAAVVVPNPHERRGALGAALRVVTTQGLALEPWRAAGGPAPPLPAALLPVLGARPAVLVSHALRVPRVLEGAGQAGRAAVGASPALPTTLLPLAHARVRWGWGWHRGGRRRRRGRGRGEEGLRGRRGRRWAWRSSWRRRRRGDGRLNGHSGGRQRRSWEWRRRGRRSGRRRRRGCRHGRRHRRASGDVNVDARDEDLVRPLAHPLPPERHRSLRHARGQAHRLGEVPTVEGVVLGAGLAPMRVDVSPLREQMLRPAEALLGLRLQVWAEAPPRVAVVVRVEHDGGLEGLPGHVGARGLLHEAAVMGELGGRVRTVRAGRAHARGRRHDAPVHDPPRVGERLVLPDAPGAVRTRGQAPRARPRDGAVGAGPREARQGEQHKLRRACRHAESGKWKRGRKG
mmetsp:Transcript_3565/g.10067  ORF Transcript_3565/g.10067 Transcript_3565/m.10067 type:complete len:592 (-) Transcript_3565:4-1779(-)